MKPYIYLRGLRHVDLSVFCVENGQKNIGIRYSMYGYLIQVVNR